MRLNKLIELQSFSSLTGAPVSGNAVIFPVRTVGLLLFCTGTIWLAIQLRKSGP